MIQNVSQTGYNQITQGQAVCHCARFTSDEILTGRKIGVNIGRYIAAVFPTDIGALIGYQTIYPSTAGSYDMPFMGLPEKYNNYKCTLTVIDNKEFTIEYCHLSGFDTDQYLTDRPYNALNEVLGITANGEKYLDLFVGVQFSERFETAHASIPITENSFCELSYNLCNDLGDCTLTGWVTGEDLTMNFYIFEGVVSSQYYAGIIRIDNYTNSNEMFNDLSLNYAEMSNIAANIEPGIGAAFTESRTIWQDSSNVFSGKLKIDNAYFEAGGVYRIWIVYKDECEWKSCISKEISQQVETELPKVFPDNTISVELNCPIGIGELTASCYHGVIPSSRATAYNTIDKDSLIAKFDDAGYPGLIWSDIFVNTEYCFSETLSENAPCVYFPIISFNVFDDTTTYLTGIEFDVPDSMAGNSFYVFNKFNFKIAGQDYQIICPILFSVIPYGDLPTIVDPLEDQICRTDADTQEICFDGVPNSRKFCARFTCGGVLLSDSEVHTTTEDDDFNSGEACLTVDYSTFPNDTECCILAASSELDEGTEECICWNFIFTWKTILITPNNIILTCGWDATALDASIIQSVKIYNKTDNKVYVDTTLINSGFFYLSYQNNDKFDSAEIEIVTTTGCFYNSALPNPFNIIPQPGNTYTQNIWICNDETPPELEAEPCELSPSFTSVCDPIGELIESILYDAGGTIVKWEWSYDFNLWTDYSTPISMATEETVYFHAEIDLGLPCGIIHLWDCVQKCFECSTIAPVNPCLDVQELSYSWVGDIITVVQTVNCTDTYNSLQFSFDTKNWFDYTVPVDTSGHNFCYLRSYIECNDGCTDLIELTWERECKLVCNGDGSGAAPDCLLTIDEDQTVCTMDLLHFNGTLGEASQTFDSHFIPTALYNDRTVIESRIRTQAVSACNDTECESCYYYIKSFYRSGLSNDVAFTAGGFVDSITIASHEMGGAITPIVLSLNTVIFATNGQFAVDLKAEIASQLTGLGFSTITNYKLTVNCAAGIVSILFDYCDQETGEWVGIDRDSCEIVFDPDGVSGLTTLTEIDDQGCPDNLSLDTSPDCQYVRSCGTLKFGATPIGGDGCGESDFLWIDDIMVFNFYTIPLKENDYDEKVTNLITCDATKYTLTGKAENFGTQVAYEWKNSGGTVVGVQNIYVTYVVDTYTLTAQSIEGCLVSINHEIIP